MIPIVGFIAGTLTAFAFLPQVIKTWRAKSAEDLSYGMLSSQSAGVALWIYYGVAIGSMPVVLSNGVTLSLALLLLVFKRVYEHPERTQGRA